MTTLEREIIEKFYQLSHDAKQRVRAVIEQDISEEAEDFDYDAWFQEVEAFRAEIRANHPNGWPSIDVVGMLREIRDGEDDE